MVISRGKHLTALVLCLAVLVGACSGGGETEDRSQTSLDDAVEQLEQMGTLRYLIAAPSSGECKVLANRDDESLLPLASVFKMYVLGALVDAVRSGEISWDDPVQIRHEFDSLGVLFGEVVLEDAGGGCPSERSVGSVVIVEVDEPVVGGSALGF